MTSNSKRSWVCNPSTGEAKLIFKSEVESYLNSGWQKGRSENKVWVTNKSGHSKMVKKNELDNYLSIGYIRGRKYEQEKAS